MDQEDRVLRVSGKTPVQSLATVISQSISDGHTPVLRAIGAGAVNQAVKACAVARSYVATRGLDLSLKPGFDNATVADTTESQSCIVLRVVVS